MQNAQRHYGGILKAEGPGTCSTTGGMRDNDYFILSTHMLHAVQVIEIQHQAATSPRLPVQIMTRPLACHTYGLQIVRPETIPKHRIVGPIQQPPSYDGTKEIPNNAQGKIDKGDKHRAYLLIDHADSSWARKAEEELCQNS